MECLPDNLSHRPKTGTKGGLKLVSSRYSPFIMIGLLICSVPRRTWSITPSIILILVCASRPSKSIYDPWPDESELRKAAYANR